MAILNNALLEKPRFRIWRFANTLATDSAGEAEEFVHAKYLNAQPALAKQLVTATFVCDSADHAHVL